MDKMLFKTKNMGNVQHAKYYRHVWYVKKTKVTRIFTLVFEQLLLLETHLVLLTAIAIAICDSVTVSIGVDTRGDFKVIFLVSAEVKSCNKYTKSLKASQPYF